MDISTRFQNNRARIVRELKAIGVINVFFTAMCVSEITSVTLLSYVGLVGTLAGVVYSHLHPKKEEEA